MDATIITALATSAGVAGTGIAFIWNKVEKRFTRIEAELEQCRNREEAARNRESRTKDRAAGQLTVIELLWMEVRRLLTATGQTESHALTRAKKLMDRLKIDLPEDDNPTLTALADELDRKVGSHDPG